MAETTLSPEAALLRAKRRRQLTRAGIVLAVLLGTASIVRTVLRQSYGPIREDAARSSRVATYAGPKPPDTGLVSGNAVVEPREPEMRLSTDTPGRIAAIHVKEGSRVEAGAILAEVENSIARAEIARAEAGITAAQAELDRTSRGMRSQDVNAVVSDALAASARSALAQSELSRTQELVSKGSLAAAELDAARRRFEAENAAANAAGARAQGARSGARQEDVVIAQAKLKAATADLEAAQATLRRTQIVAPTAGNVLRIKLRPGEYHNPMSGEPILILGDTSRLRVRMDADERDVARLKPDQTAYVTALAFHDQKFTGKVVEVAARMGRRNVRVDDPLDRIDVKVLEVVLDMDGTPPLVAGMRVTAFVQAPR